MSGITSLKSRSGAEVEVEQSAEARAGSDGATLAGPKAGTGQITAEFAVFIYVNETLSAFKELRRLSCRRSAVNGGLTPLAPA